MADVPECRDCGACCRAFAMILVLPTDPTPHELRDGDMMAYIGEEPTGHCAALVNGRCGVYEARPQTCRTFERGTEWCAFARDLVAGRRDKTGRATAQACRRRQ